MVEFGSGVWPYATAAIALVLVSLSCARIGGMKGRERAIVLAALGMSLLLFFAEGAGPLQVLLLEIGVLTFNGLLSGATPARRASYVMLSMLYIALIHWISFVHIAQAMLIGMLAGVTNLKEYRSRMEDRATEIRRDLFHVSIGIVLMAVFYFEPSPVAITAQLLLILVGIISLSFAEAFRKNRISGIIYGLERNGSSLGHGALWLALGSLFAVSFLGTSGVLAAFAAIFIGDPIATIVGIRAGGMKLPYNSRKSVAGTTAYFVATSAASYPFIGAYCVVLGLVAALVESAKLGIDDNFSVSVVATALLRVIAA